MFPTINNYSVNSNLTALALQYILLESVEFVTSLLIYPTGWLLTSVTFVDVRLLVSKNGMLFFSANLTNQKHLSFCMNYASISFIPQLLHWYQLSAGLLNLPCCLATQQVLLNETLQYTAFKRSHVCTYLEERGKKYIIYYLL